MRDPGTKGFWEWDWIDGEGERESGSREGFGGSSPARVFAPGGKVPRDVILRPVAHDGSGINISHPQSHVCSNDHWMSPVSPASPGSIPLVPETKVSHHPGPARVRLSLTGYCTRYRTVRSSEQAKIRALAAQLSTEDRGTPAGSLPPKPTGTAPELNLFCGFGGFGGPWPARRYWDGTKENIAMQTERIILY